ncbi:MAG: MFS transporter [Deltaproteobacteria bacterium]|nr:MFS transporter [Deltaproteobacteria bacterium]
MKPGPSSLLILFSVVVLDLIGFGIVMPILPFYAEKYGANATVLGLLLMSYAAMQFLFSPLWGRLSDRIGRKKVLILTMAGSVLGLLVLGLANSLALLFAGRILSGIFGANISVASAYVTDVTTAENRAKGMGMIGAAFGIGFILGPALGGALSIYGYHVPILTAAGLSAINVVYALFRLGESASRNRDGQGGGMAEVLRIPLVQRLCAINFLFTLGVNQLESIFAFFMADRFRYDAQHVAYILALMALIMVAIQGGMIKRLVMRFGEKRLLTVGSVCLALAFVLVPESPSVGLLLIPLAISSVGRGISQPSLMSLVSRGGDESLHGSVMGTFQASASLARVAGPVLAGVLYDRNEALPFFLACGLLGAVFLLSLNIPVRDAKQSAHEPRPVEVL